MNTPEPILFDLFLLTPPQLVDLITDQHHGPLDEYAYYTPLGERQIFHQMAAVFHTSYDAFTNYDIGSMQKHLERFYSEQTTVFPLSEEFFQIIEEAEKDIPFLQIQESYKQTGTPQEGSIYSILKEKGFTLERATGGIENQISPRSPETEQDTFSQLRTF